MNLPLYIVIYILTIAGFLGVGLLVLLRQNSLAYKNFALFCFLIAAWQGLQFVSQAFFGGSATGVLLFRLSVVASCFTGMYFLFYAAAYTGKKLKPVFYIVGACIASLLAIISPQLQGAEISREGISLPPLDIFYALAMAYAGLCAFYGIGLIFKSTLASRTKRQRQQGLLLIGGILQALLVVIGVTVLTPDNSETQILIPIVTFLAVAVVAYAMAFYGLFDIHSFVLRAAAYLTTLLILTVGCIAPLLWLSARVLDFHPSILEFVLVTILASLGVYAMYYLRDLFDRITTRIFFRNYYNPQEVLSRISNLLAATIDVAEIKGQSQAILQSTLNPSSIGFLLDEKSDHVRLRREMLKMEAAIIDTDELSRNKHASLYDMLRKDGIALAVRLHTTHGDLGYITLGYRRSGVPYSYGDQQLILAVADQLAVGLQNALRFEEIQQFNATLQNKIEEATRKLRHSNEKLRALDQTKDDFISMASHQLRTPLTSVKGYVSMVLDGDAGQITPLQRKLLTQSFVSSQRMVYLISDLLNVSRLRTGKFVIEPVPTNLVQVIKDESEQLQETAKGRGLTLHFNHPETFPTLMLDETKIRQVIMNFMDNAIYYTPAGGEITVNLVEKPQSVEFTVIDNGIGVPKHEQHHLFSKFYRAHNAKRARPDGTGLGLFMAKKVIVAQGGAIIFKSQEKKGSTFGFTFAKEPLLAPVLPQE